MNLTKQTDKIRQRVRVGFPNGVDEESRNDLPTLLNRIEELETALAPFAKLAMLPNDGKELVMCYSRDCEKALQAMTSYTLPEQSTEVYFPA
jgi:hypothetical protein